MPESLSDEARAKQHRPPSISMISSGSCARRPLQGRARRLTIRWLSLRASSVRRCRPPDAPRKPAIPSRSSSPPPRRRRHRGVRQPRGPSSRPPRRSPPQAATVGSRVRAAAPICPAAGQTVASSTRSRRCSRRTLASAGGWMNCRRPLRRAQCRAPRRAAAGGDCRVAARGRGGLRNRFPAASAVPAAEEPRVEADGAAGASRRSLNRSPRQRRLSRSRSIPSLRLPLRPLCRSTICSPNSKRRCARLRPSRCAPGRLRSSAPPRPPAGDIVVPPPPFVAPQPVPAPPVMESASRRLWAPRSPLAPQRPPSL